MDTLNRWFEQEKAKADFRVIYVAEAHPTDGRQVPANVRDKVLIERHKELAARKTAAKSLRDTLGLKLPIFVDSMDDRASRDYGAWPDRIYIVDRYGKLAYVGAMGPSGFKPKEAREALALLR